MNPEKTKKLQKVMKIITTVLTLACFIFTLVMLVVCSNQWTAIKDNYPDSVPYQIGIRVGIYAFGFISVIVNFIRSRLDARRKKKIMEKIPQEALAAIKMLPPEMLEIIQKIPPEALQ